MVQTKRRKYRKVDKVPLRCQFLEFQPKQWLYVYETPKERLQAGCNYGLWDWREFAILKGPFNSLEDAKKDQKDNFPKLDNITVQVFDTHEINNFSHLLRLNINILLGKEIFNAKRIL